MAERTGAAIYLMHVSAGEGVDAIAEARSRGQPIFGETLHHYTTFNSQVYKEEDGPLYHTYPSLKYQEDADALWRGLVEGPLSTVATDVLWCGRDLKLSGKTIETTVGGSSATEERVGITYTEGVVKRGMPLQRFVDVTSANAAKIMGLYPQKGVIAPGSDADLVLIDPNFKRALRMDDFHISDYSIWEGFPVEGWPVMTILRGAVAVENGQLNTSLGSGKFLSRKVNPEVTNRPTC
jgi:dihydropyrimidinase